MLTRTDISGELWLSRRNALLLQKLGSPDIDFRLHAGVVLCGTACSISLKSLSTSGSTVIAQSAKSPFRCTDARVGAAIVRADGAMGIIGPVVMFDCPSQIWPPTRKLRPLPARRFRLGLGFMAAVGGARRSGRKAACQEFG